MLFVLLLIAILLAATVHIALSGSTRASAQRVVEVLLVYLLAGYYGACMFLAGLIHLVNGEALDQLKGWPPAGQFHVLYAFALFGLAASATLTVWYRGVYLLGPALAGSLLLLGGAYVHISNMVTVRRFVPATDGPEVLLDLGVPLTVLGLLAANGRARAKSWR